MLSAWAHYSFVVLTVWERSEEREGKKDRKGKDESKGGKIREEGNERR